MKTLNTGVKLTYQKNGDIKTCVSLYDKEITNKPLPKNK